MTPTANSTQMWVTLTMMMTFFDDVLDEIELWEEEMRLLEDDGEFQESWERMKAEMKNQKKKTKNLSDWEFFLQKNMEISWVMESWC
ncbi:unnamed protein product [Blepharisma stoltei]|uniref:Uncharacterized protein n=1 Tax=Blepharisma stoltei TaxID=1481888 RepID=A0AAU9IVB0_9CILI|nr:unnamed protein product [Blepharisma stoltei]